MEISSRGFLGYPWYYQHEFFCLLSLYIPGVMYFEMYSYFYLLYMFVFSCAFLCIMLVMLNKSNQIKSNQKSKTLSGQVSGSVGYTLITFPGLLSHP